jgi:WXG100 family type VII secretion target
VSGPQIRWDYDQLNQIAQLFDGEADKTRKTVDALKRQMEVLEGGDWVGEGARAFYAEMNGSVLPAFGRLVNGLSSGAQTVRKISALAHDTEDEAARMLNRVRAAAVVLGMMDPAAGAALGAAIRAAALANPGTAFDTVGSSGVSEAEAPASIRIPQTLSKGMQDAWKDSFPGGHSHEQGGILVRKADGTYEWRPGKDSAGTSGTFQPDYSVVKSGEALAAVGHTHPYDKTEGSFTNVPFSGQDMARMVYVDEPMHFVQSGDTRFALMRTKEFDKSISGLSDADKQTMFNNMKNDWDSAFKSAKGKLPDRADAAVKAVATKYHLVYYRGTGDTLSK